MTNTEETTLVSEGQRTVISISLPKNPKSPSRKVTFERDEGRLYGPSGWTYEDQLGGIAIGMTAQYRIEKNAEGFHKLVSIAPVATDGNQQRAQTAGSAEVPPDRDDAQAGAETPNLDSPAPAERDLRKGAVSGGGPVPTHPPEPAKQVPNEDTQRFEGWAFVANVGMVDLAYEELSDALEAGELDSITPELLKTVAQHLLNAADQAQRSLVGRTDRGAQSHVRARGCVRTALRKYPVRGERTDTGGSQLSQLDAWASDVTKTATRLLALAASL